MALPAVKFSASALAQALVQTVVPTQSSGEGGFLKFDGKVGGWSYGRDQEAADGEVILVNTPTIGHGWVMWVDAQPQEKRLTRFNEPMPDPMDPVPIKVKKAGKLVDDLSEPAESRILQGAFLEDGEAVTFETSSYSGRAAVDSLLAEIKQKAVSGSPYLFPAVKLGESSYYNKTYKTDIYTPVLEVISWHDQDGVEEPSDGEQKVVEAEIQPEPAVKAAVAAKAARKPRAGKAAPAEEAPKAEEPVTEPAAPVRRRRAVA
jgi:hypothetical protein